TWARSIRARILPGCDRPTNSFRRISRMTRRWSSSAGPTVELSGWRARSDRQGRAVTSLRSTMSRVRPCQRSIAAPRSSSTPRVMKALACPCWRPCHAPRQSLCPRRMPWSSWSMRQGWCCALTEGRPRLVISVNPERIMQAGRDPEFAAILRRADLALADGAGVLWAARRLGHPLPGRVAGVDFVTALAARGAHEGWRFFFLGGAPGVAEAAGRVLGERYPGFTLAGTHAGSADPGSDLDTTQAVRSSGAQLLFLAYGAAAEAAWLARNPPGSGAIIGMGVGGTFD